MLKSINKEDLESLIENETFTVVHNGSLYKGQDITLFAEATRTSPLTTVEG